MTPQEKLEQLLDLIADELILSDFINTEIIEENQKFIRNGLLQSDIEGGGVLALFQKDIKANQEDLIPKSTFGNLESIPSIQNIANQILDFNTLVITISNYLEGDNTFISIKLSNGGLPNVQDITSYIVGDNNPLNVSQFIPLQQSSSIVNVERAEEY